MKETILSSIEKAAVKLRRKRIAKNIFDLNSGRVQQGAFKGLQLIDDSNISKGPLALRIYGLYEEVVVNEIIQHKYDDVLNIGSADGYFSLGLLKSGNAKRAICFEATKKGQAAIIDNAKKNNFESNVEVFGIADSTITQKLDKVKLNTKNALVICDIEGGEFSLFNQYLFKYLDGCKIIIELHDRIQGLKNVREKLVSNIPASYKYKIIKSKPVDWSNIDLLEKLSDNDRSLVLSEGRKCIGEWLVLTPLSA